MDFLGNPFLDGRFPDIVTISYLHINEVIDDVQSKLRIKIFQ